MTEQELNILIHRQLTGQISPEEEVQFQQWLTKDEANVGYFQEMAEIWASAETLDLSVQPETDTEWEKLQQSLGMEIHAERTSGKVVRMRVAWRLAAAAAIMLGVAFWWLMSRGDAGLQAPLSYVAANGQIENITLPDGTLVALNAGSSLEVKKGFGGADRQVELSGEAFFEVKSDRSKPFMVDAAGATIRVVGTAFNVRAYPGSQTVTTSVAEGKVEFYTNAQNKVLLSPGAEGILDKSAVKITTKQVETLNVAAWREGKIIFDNLPLVEALDILGRRYGVSVKIEGNIEGKRLFSTFENEPFEDILKTLELTYDLNLTIKNDTLLVQDR